MFRRRMDTYNVVNQQDKDFCPGPGSDANLRERRRETFSVIV
jgi:hypothetical protein